MSEPFDLAIDASRNRSGGAKSHLIGLLGAARPQDHGIGRIHVFSYRALLDALPDRPWLIRHNPAALEKGLPAQLAWQRFRLARSVRAAGCSMTLNCDAGTIATVRPAVTMSRDMLSYEPGEVERYGYGKARLRLRLLERLQNHSLTSADGAIFLTRYAAETIQRSAGPVRRLAIIPHGVGEEFRALARPRPFPSQGERAIRCIYVSNAALHKHQWHVVRAIRMLRERGRAVEFVLAGGGGSGAQRLEMALAADDPKGEFTRCLPFLTHHQLTQELAEADLFVFASSCENMPNTLIEGMASGLPIATSDRGPMPEVLRDGGLYFDPENPAAIASALEHLIDNEELRVSLVNKAMAYAAEFSWDRCARETLSFLAQCHAAVH
jgi:glycosyltransferase involved in cell wall biosynthesis